MSETRLPSRSTSIPRVESRPSDRRHDDRRPRQSPSPSQRRQRRSALSPGGWVSAGSWLATVTAASGLGAVALGEGWWWLAAFVAGLAITASALVRRRFRGPVLPLLAALIVAAASLVTVFAGSTLAYLVVPTGETIERLRQLGVEASVHIASETMPASQNTGLDLLLVTGIVAVAIVIEALAVSARVPLLAGVPLLILVIAPGRAADDPPSILPITLTLGSVLLLLWLDRQRASRRPPIVAAVGVGLLAVLGGVVGQSVAPAFEESAATGATLRPVFGAGAEPLVRLGDHLRRGLDVPALRYETTSTDPLYLRVIVIDDLTGEEWRSADPDTEYPIDSLPPATGLSDSVERSEVSTRIDDSFAERRWLPLPYPAVSVGGLDDAAAWSYRPDSLTVGTLDESRRTGDYEVQSLQLEPTAEQLRGAPAAVGFDQYEALPADVPAVIGETAEAVTAGIATDYDRALALQQYLRSADFSYDEETPEEADGDGDSFDVIATFLEEKRGYCVHFASAMTVMAREIGIPARIAVGYQPGERLITESGVYEVTSHDLHAWPELYFEGVGWTRFEPTPGRGVVPSYTLGTQPQTEEEAAAPQPTPTASAAAPVREDDVDAADPAAGGSADAVALWFLLVPLAVILLLAAPAFVRAALRRRRLAALRDGLSSPAWEELTATASDLGLARGRSSPRGLESALVEEAPLDAEDAALVMRWRIATERERFGRPGTAVDSGISREDAVRVLAKVRGGTGALRRGLALVLPRSLAEGVLERVSPIVDRRRTALQR